MSQVKRPYRFKTLFGVCELEEALPQIVDSLPTLPDSTFCEIFKEALELGPRSVSWEELEGRVLEPLLPLGQTRVQKCLEEISYSLENLQEDYLAESVVSSFVDYLETCQKILEGFGLLVDYLDKKGNVDIYCVATLPGILLQIVLDVYKHCRDSEVLYGPVFQSVTSQLTDLFGKCSEIQGPFFEMLREKINFNQCLLNDLPVLLDVLEKLSLIGEAVIHLNVKTMADLWKVYAKLVEKYRVHLVQNLDVSKPILVLSSELSLVINNITKEMNEADAKSRMRHLKLATFLLKIIVKLCEEFEGALGDCCQEALLDLLISLNGCSRVHSLGMTSEEVGEELYRHLTVGATPLLSHLVCDPMFIKAFNKKVDELSVCENEEKLGVFFVTLGVLKHMVKCPLRFESIWPCISFIRSLLNCFKSCCDVVDFNLKFDERISYVCLISMTGSYLVSAASPADFKEVERILFSLVFQMRVSPAIFACDLLCLLSRLSNDEVCLSQVIYLCKVLTSWPRGEYLRPERVNACWLLSRLFPILSEKSKATISRMFPFAPNLQLWAFLSHSSHSYILEKMTQVLNTLSDPSAAMSIANYDNFLTLLLLASDSFSQAKEKTPLVETALDALMMVERRLVLSLPNELTPCKGIAWWCRLLDVFLSAASAALHLMTNSQLSQVLELVSLTLSKKETLTTLSCLTFLHGLPSFSPASDGWETGLKGKMAAACASSLQAERDPLLQLNSLTLASTLYQWKGFDCPPRVRAKGAAFVSGSQSPPQPPDTKHPLSPCLPFTHKCLPRPSPHRQTKRLKPDDTRALSLASQSIDNLTEIVHFMSNNPLTSTQLHTLLSDVVELAHSLKAFL